MLTSADRSRQALKLSLNETANFNSELGWDSSGPSSWSYQCPNIAIGELDRHWWASDVKRLNRVTQMQEMSRGNPAEVDENNVSRLFRALEVGPRPTRAL